MVSVDDIIISNDRLDGTNWAKKELKAILELNNSWKLQFSLGVFFQRN